MSYMWNYTSLLLSICLYAVNNYITVSEGINDHKKKTGDM